MFSIGKFKVHISTKEVNAKKMEIKAKKKAHFWGHPLIQAEEAKMLGLCYKIEGLKGWDYKFIIILWINQVNWLASVRIWIWHLK